MKTEKMRLISLVTAFMLVFTLAALLPEGWLPKAKASDIAFNYKDKAGAEWYCWNISGSFDDGYKTGDVKLLAVSGINLFTDITIPSVVYDEDNNPHTVTALGFYGGIGKGLFEGKTNLESVTIPNTVTMIDKKVFNSCTGLTEVTIPDSVQEFGDFVFEGCSNLTKVNIPNGVKKVSWRMFYACEKLETIVIPDSVTFIDYEAFRNCAALGDITLSKNLQTISYGAFGECDALADITIPASVEAINEHAFDTCHNLKKVFFPTGSQLKTIGDEAFAFCENLTTIRLPDTVTELGKAAFAGCTSLAADSQDDGFIIPKNVTKIGDGCFAKSGLFTVTIPKNLVGISKRAFDKCSNLRYVYIPEGVQWIGDSAFSNCENLTHIFIPKSVEKIYDSLEKKRPLTFENSPNVTVYGFKGTAAETVANNAIITRPFVDMDGLYKSKLSNTKYVLSKSGASALNGEMIRLVLKVGGQTIGYKITDVDAGVGYTVTANTANLPATQKVSGIQIETSVSFGSTQFGTSNSIAKGTALEGQTDMPELLSDSLMRGVYKEIFKYEFKGMDGSFEISHNFRPVLAELDAEGMTKVPAKDPTCTEDGNIEYYKDSGDDEYGYVMNGDILNRVKMEDLAIKATGHSFVDTVKEPTCTEKGCTVHKCSVCQYECTDTYVNALGHIMSKTVAKEPTCTAAGNSGYWSCSECGKFFKDGNATTEIAENSWVIPAKGHSFGKVTYTWSADGKSCTASRKCNNCTTTETEKATISSKVKTAATCTAMGVTTYTASFTNKAFTAQTKDVTDIAAKGHSFGKATYSWSADGKSCTASRKCANCTATETEKATVTSTVKTPATCTAMGVTTYTASFTNKAFTAQTKDVTDIAAKGHSFGKATYTWADDGKSCTASRKCANCTATETEKATVTSTVKTPATETAMGVTTYTATFKNKAFAAQTKDVTDIPKLSDRIPGDANDDKQVNIMDVLVIRQHLAGWNVSINLSNANVNGDKTVNIQDVLLIRQNLAGWNVALV